MNRTDIANELSKRSNITKEKAREMVDMFVDIMVEGLKKDGEIRLVNFGVIKTVINKARDVHSAIVGGIIKIPDRMVVKFKASGTLNKIVDDDYNSKE